MITVHMTTAKRFQNGLLPNAVESVLNQTFRDFELVVCDDASSDGTADYLAGVATRDSRVRVLRNPRNEHSVAISLGRCLEASDATRPFISWMFDDNELAPDAFELLVEAWADEPHAGVVFGVTQVPLSGGGEILVGDQPVETIRQQIESNSCLVPNAGILIHRDVFDRVGWYDASILMRRSCDWELFLRIFRSDTAIRTISHRIVEERGDLEPDSLRNSFTTSLALMQKYSRLRDLTGWPVDLRAALYHPTDRIPEGNWSDDELRLCRHIFVEYYRAVGRPADAANWVDSPEAIPAGWS
jgi:glycosyltransferase involved in cell wall biosynthesis